MGALQIDYRANGKDYRDDCEDWSLLREHD
jgi:hypothetical protein